MYKRGFTVFFAVLVASLALAIGLAIYDLLIRELELSQTATQSQYAIYAADTGAECALYWDLNYGGIGSTAFSTSTASSPPASGVNCDGQDIAAVGTPPSPFALPPTSWTAWSVVESSDAATTTFWIVIEGTKGNPCAVVEVAKYIVSVGDPPRTKITSRGRNTCDSNATLQLERALEVNY